MESSVFLYYILIFFILALHLFALNKLLNSDDVLEHGIFVIVIMLIEFCVLSGVYFFFNIFSFRIIILTQCAISVGGALIVIIRERGINYKWGVVHKENLILLGILILGIPLVASKFEICGMGQDEGVYQTEAVALMNGEFALTHSFEEYNILDSEQKKEFEEKTNGNIYIGFYEAKDAASRYPTATKVEWNNPTEGWFHGVHVFSSMLAFWGKLFGMENMAQLQTLIWICTAAVFFFTIKRVQASSGLNTIIIMLLFTFSPLMIWVFKTTLTETFLTLSIALYLYGILDTKNEWIAGIGIIGFAFMHISFFILVPILILVQTYLYFQTKKRTFLILNIVTGISLSLAYYIMASIAPQYFFDNLSKMYFKGIITANNILYGMLIVSILICLLSLILMKIDTPKWISFLIKNEKVQWYCRIAIIISLLMIALYWYKIGFCNTPQNANFRESLQQYWGNPIKSLGHLAIVAFVICSGVVSVPIAMTGCLRKWDSNISSREITIFVLFIYCIFFLSAVFRKEIYYYYYYARYLVIYFPIIFLAVFLTLRKVKWTFAVIMGMVSIMMMMPYNGLLITRKDLTYFTWEGLEGLSDFVKEDSAIIIESEEFHRIAGLNLKYNADVDVFPRFEDTNKEIAKLKENYSSVYYLTPIPFEKNLNLQNLNYQCKEPVYEDVYLFQKYEETVLPRAAVVEYRNIIMYEF